MSTIVKVGRLIDGTGAPPAREMAVRIEGDTIAAVPGLIDCHDHVAHLGLDVKRRFDTPPSLAVLETGRWVKETLLAGVTTLRDAAGVDLGVKMAVEQGVIPGPRLLISLVIITQTGGHGDLTQPSGVSSNFPTVPGVPSGIADGVDDVRRKVREVLRLGADRSLVPAPAHVPA